MNIKNVITKDEIPDVVKLKLKQLDIAFEKLRLSKLDEEFIIKWNMPHGGGIEEIERWKNDLYSDRRRLSTYKQELAHLVDEIELPREFKNSLEDYLLLGGFTFSSDLPEAKFSWNEQAKEKELWVRIFGTTRKDDLRNPKLWANIKSLQKKLPDYVKKKSEWIYYPEHKRLVKGSMLKQGDYGYGLDSFELSKIKSRYSKRMKLKSQK